MRIILSYQAFLFVWLKFRHAAESQKRFVCNGIDLLMSKTPLGYVNPALLVAPPLF